jgi:hypothetical protein
MCKPTYTHDCEECKSLGTVHVKDETYDLYVCTKFSAERPSLIARYGNEGHEYYSNTVGAVSPEFSAAAIRIAKIAYEGEYYDNPQTKP